MCTKHDALSILRGWHDSNTPFLLKLQPAAGAEFLFIKRRIAHLVSEEFIFESRAVSVTVNCSQVGFEYEELPKCVHKPALQRTSMRELKPQLSAAQDASFRDELIERELTMTLSEMTV